MSNEYQPGKCNIGREEAKYRKGVVGYGSAVIAGALYIMLVFFNFSLAVYVLLLIPVFVSVHGFIESKNKFCTSYGRAGKYNMNSEVGLTQDVHSQEKRNKDKQFANKLIIKSLKITVVITLGLTLLSELIN